MVVVGVIIAILFGLVGLAILVVIFLAYYYWWRGRSRRAGIASASH
jgi:uncharacterized iron-regulated membrane protein